MYFFRCYITARTVKFNHLLVVFFQQLTSMGNYINYILSLIWVNIYIQMLLCVQTTQITFYDLIPKKTERKTCKFQCFQMHHMSLSRFSILHNTYQAVSIILSEFQAFVQPWKYHIKLKSPPQKKLLLWAEISQDLGHRSSGGYWVHLWCCPSADCTSVGRIRVLQFHLLGWLCACSESTASVDFLCFPSWLCLRVSMHFPQYMSIQCL